MSRLGNQFAEVINRWSPENPSETLPRAALNNPGRNSRTSDWFVEDAGYFRLTNWQIGYDFNRLFGNNSIKIQRMRLYIGGNNAFTITKWKGVDPDSDMVTPDGYEFRTPTSGRSFIVGLDMTF